MDASREKIRQAIATALAQAIVVSANPRLGKIPATSAAQRDLEDIMKLIDGYIAECVEDM